MVIVRCESSTNNWLTRPFEMGVRHLKVAFCDGSQDTLTQMARERVIHRAVEPEGHGLIQTIQHFIGLSTEGKFAPLGLTDRFSHIFRGVLETAGYLSVVTPFITAFLDPKPSYIKGGYAFRTHMEESGNFHSWHWRKNPFDENGASDPFYRGASWTRI